MSVKDILIGIAVGIFVSVLIIIAVTTFGIAYINNSPGYYMYTIDIKGLENYEPGLITDIIVPLPQRDGQLVFSDDELQYKTFGNWKSTIVVTKFGKMLAFQSVDRNLTDIHAEFIKSSFEGMVIRNITQESLSPALPLMHSDYSQSDDGSNSGRDYSTIVYIPDTIRPLHGSNDFITIVLELNAYEGMQHSISGKAYRVSVSERIPPGTYNSTLVVAQVSEIMTPGP